MNPERLRELLHAVQAGKSTIDDALSQLQRLPYQDLGFAHVDHHRALRQGVPEVVFGEGKTPDQIATIAQALIEAEQPVLVTRLDRDKGAQLVHKLPQLSYNEQARTATHGKSQVHLRISEPTLVVTAGTSDVPVAAEALETLQMCGLAAEGLFDVGVAGIHRVLHQLERLRAAPAIIVCAGMEGALASVVGGLVASPVVAVPTSIGYGASAGGIAALLGMLSSCAAGISVVNIDNGFGAAMVVVRHLTSREARQ